MTIIAASLLNLNTLVPQLLGQYGAWLYAGLFLLIFIETGLVVFPFLPGDSILFLCGSLAAGSGNLHLGVLLVTLTIAAVLGDFVNFEIGKRFGHYMVTHDRFKRWLKPQHLDRASAFFAKYGGLAIFLGRFIPIIRTLVPFTAGMGRMPYLSFARYNVMGGVTWMAVVLGAGYLFGNIPVVQQNFELIMVAIVLISLLPVGLAMLKRRGTVK
ncbi:VTT domain-containing protein [Levilactobacillus acidifarinae]|uniref:DedA protein (DSG-1 protein) n=1 Tax=Levilactobacillus acidifarinae DSM 19394 = JCM 15949 TaxID=1423715 RepID=A0A0R1LG84_9LACO|nr:VTT domain-containing protein [Levilactobacillus acidifarinae]KRK94440.1 DedA protein (DSG-1 protein) [Levilactobacillus acidifarinae DSM 19394]GEO68183.1 cytochrome o ubiquinol oxidase [Levilactobacillus acidifarinae]